MLLGDRTDVRQGIAVIYAYRGIIVSPTCHLMSQPKNGAYVSLAFQHLLTLPSRASAARCRHTRVLDYEPKKPTRQSPICESLCMASSRRVASCTRNRDVRHLLDRGVTALYL